MNEDDFPEFFETLADECLAAMRAIAAHRGYDYHGVDSDLGHTIAELLLPYVDPREDEAE